MDRYDVIVVGAGTAGIPCAIEAAAAGAIVLLVEKDHRIGGTLHTSGGHMSAAGTRRQAERSIVDSPERHFADIERISNNTMRADIVRRAVELAPVTVDWLEDRIDWDPECPRLVYGHEPYSVPRTVYGRDGGLSILRALEPLLNEAIARGAIELRLNTPVTGLRTDGGRVVGVTIWTEGGDEDVNAASVVLATGGFASDPEVFAEIEGVPLVSAAHPTSQGDGLLLARAVGAAVGGLGSYLPTFGGLPHPTSATRVDFTDRPLLATAERAPWEIYVDRAGRRFVAEDEPSIDHKERALARVPDMTFWTVFDAQGHRESTPMIVGWTAEQLAERAGRRAGVHMADSLENLALVAAISPEGLKSTVDEYNTLLAAGAPDPYGRRHRPAPIVESPFFALENHGITLICFAGVDVDGNLAVRREDGSTIDGLYAVGEVFGAAVTSGNAFCGGMMVTPSLALGRWLGTRLGNRFGTSTRS